jgi:DNA-binding response OmpR family regulator
MHRLLVVTDDAAFGRQTSETLLAANHAVDVAALAGGAWAEAAADRPTMAVLLDLRANARPIPGAIEEVRKELARLGITGLPLLVVLKRADVGKHPVLPGATDVLVYPFPPEELLLRAAQCFYRGQATQDGRHLQVGGLVIDQDAYRVTVDGEPVELTYKEFELLRYLVGRRGRVFSREALLAQVWGYGYFGGTRTVDVHVRRIRTKIGARYESLIHTVRNVGYRFEDEPESESADAPDVFLAGVMQGSHGGRDLHPQDYRATILALLARHAPGARVFDPFAKHQSSVEYGDDEGKRVFLHHIEVARRSKLVLCWLPTASMGTALEMWEAHGAGATVWTISPLSTNWVIRFFSHRVFPDLAAFEAAIAEGALDALRIGRRGGRSDR